MSSCIGCCRTAQLPSALIREFPAELVVQLFVENLTKNTMHCSRWNTNKKGDYFAIGVGGAVTGKGADVLIIDDPHSEQEAALGAYNTEVYDKVYEWYTSGPRQRLQPGGAIIIVMTRWSVKDLTGQIVKSATQREGADEWEVIELPAIMPSGEPLWPEFWPVDQLEALKAELPISKWSAQYQQDPTAEEGALIKREWWQEWEYENPPPCEAIIQSWDTAFLKTQRADYSACTTWGIFNHPRAPGVHFFTPSLGPRGKCTQRLRHLLQGKCRKVSKASPGHEVSRRFCKAIALSASAQLMLLRFLPVFFVTNASLQPFPQH